MPKTTPEARRQATVVITYDGAQCSLRADVSPPETVAILEMAKYIVLDQNLGQPGRPVPGPAKVQAGAKFKGRPVA